MSFKHTSGDSVVSGDFSKLESLIKKLKTNMYVDVGILGGGSFEGGATIAGIGAVHEFGTIINVSEKMRKYLHVIGIHLKKETTTIKIPERSFIRMPLEKKQKDITKQLEKKLDSYLEKQDIEGFLKLIGIVAESIIQEAFETGGFGEWPDIKQITKDNKESSSILIDKGDLRKAITSQVGKG